MTTALLSLGSNLGDPYAQLQAAHQFFAPWTVAASPIYRTAPWGVTNQPDFRNTALLVTDPHATPETWLQRAHTAETKAHRERTQKWGPRTLDVDIIACWDTDSGTPYVQDDPHLTLPHPRARERAFVLIPALQVLTDAAPTSPLIPEFQQALEDLPATQRAGVRLDNPDEPLGGAP
ncbi:MAG: 2-amino-4-hydroxy-6-hydroxymethyldihydropteridine diphosphokinase [Lawsonella sp.]